MSMTGISNSYNNYVTQNTNDTTKKNVAKSNSRQVEFKEFNSEIKEPKLSTVAKMFQMKLGKPMGIWTSWYMRMGKMQRSCFPAVQKSLQLCFPQKNQRKWLLVRNTKTAN